MVDEGILANYGRKTVDTRNAFIAGQTAMFIDSTAVLRGVMDSVAGKFEVGTAYLPRPNEAAYETAGTIIGGGSLMGGKGDMKGAFFGTAFVALLENAFNLFEINSLFKSVVVGAALILVVLFDGYVHLKKMRELGKV